MVLNRELDGELKEKIESKLVGDKKVIYLSRQEDSSSTEFVAKDKEKGEDLSAYRWGLYEENNQENVKWIADIAFDSIVKDDLDTFEELEELKLTPLEIARGIAGISDDYRTEIFEIVKETIEDVEKEEAEEKIEEEAPHMN
ncbi:hypothetical protein AKJ51_00545 [candidate division MSBL1 archaeon SCGC-AAA382A20]|uniref:Uncharacterized protein n=1 Tax=candidate division MSBL1 archaeon SCGC-AAA382A20 TaxID=1698280 RepID=A0A133VMM8_9EURY|nr:hypothetical protein AKJ51_00545 [candidate division MSBL1 archaeon SCGC-AAA382A20]